MLAMELVDVASDLSAIRMPLQRPWSGELMARVKKLAKAF